MNKNALLIFTRNPELGKVKTRLAATIGNEAALEIYKFLLHHTFNITKNLNIDKFIYYAETIIENDSWNEGDFQKKQQKGNDLGERMKNAFTETFAQQYQKIIIIGSDNHQIQINHIEEAFKTLNKNDFVIGPAKDGGYYLLGMKKLHPNIFQNKNWGTNTVLKNTLIDLKNEKIHLLEPLNDIDTYDDIKNDETFKTFISSNLTGF